MMIDADRGALFKMAMDYSHWTTHPRIVRAFIDKSGDTIEWLEDKGLKFNFIPQLYPNQVPRTWHCVERGGAAVVGALVERCKAMGITVLCDTAAKQILTNNRGRMTGVLALTRKGRVRIIADSVIIATGGYGGNRKLLKKYFPPDIRDAHLDGLPHMGDGLTMATQIGGATEGLGILHLFGPRVQKSLHMTAVATEPNTLWLNTKGERFADEAISFRFPEAANAVNRQPGKISYTIFDSKIKQSIIKEGLIKGIGVFFVPQRTKLKELDRELKLEVGKGRTLIADSWRQIAKWIGVKVEALTGTVDQYNSFCDRGHDEMFAKDHRYLIALRNPPYFAIKCCVVFHSTIGGIKINHRMELLDKYDNPVPGVYAAGTDTGGWESDTYCDTLSGSAFGFAINSGRIAGENASRYVLRNN
jgi:fumarate reductase flavoprotein subunit